MLRNLFFQQVTIAFGRGLWLKHARRLFAEMGFNGKFNKKKLSVVIQVINVILFPIMSLRIILKVKRHSIETENNIGIKLHSILVFLWYLFLTIKWCSSINKMTIITKVEKKILWIQIYCIIPSPLSQKIDMIFF